MRIMNGNWHRWIRRTSRLAGLTALLLLFPVSNMAQQVLDLCGCAATPDLRPFNAGDPATYPPGTTGCSGPCTSGTITFALPPDGIMRFSSFIVDGGFQIFFGRNAANTPVTILVAGDIRLRGANGCCQNFSLSGNAGSNASSSGTAGVGGLGGPGGFRGADGSALAVNGFAVGGTGLGPGGGAGGTATGGAGGGTFFGVPELVPLVGGSGGGGGAGFGSSTSCTGGGGGGGGGALLMVANGSLTIQNYVLDVNGGNGGGVGSGSCANGGGGGSAGAIRLVAGRLIDNGTAILQANAGGAGHSSSNGTPGRIRLESLDASAQTMFTPGPAAIRVTGPGPLANPVSPTVRITAVAGQGLPAVPQGGYGAIDVVLPAPGVTGVDIATSGVPSGTTVLVTVKPRIGGNALSSTVPLATCNSAGECTATTAFSLSAGAYVVEARATFQVQ
jgi:hypothetical protein